MKPDAYIICATPRSGSTLLCDLLAGTGKSGHPNSFYRPPSIPDWIRRWGLDGDAPDFDRTYLEAARREGTANTGMFGLRQMWNHKVKMDITLARLFPDLSEMARLEAAFGSIRFLHLRREDLVAQAVSHAKAEQSGLWHQHANGSPREQLGERREPIYDHDQIAALLAETNADNTRWNAWFEAQGIDPLRLTYEALAADPQQVLDRILQDFTLPSAKAVIKSRKLSGKQNADWGDRFRSETA